MKVLVTAIELDTSIQCRAAIDTATVNDYAERMAAGDEFPAVELYGTKSKAWIGDGWHRILAARQLGLEEIRATVHAGGRPDALKHALGANAVHGYRRSNADKRRCVEIALAEFPKLSSRAVAKLCGVSHVFVEGQRPRELETVTSSKRAGLDGKERPATGNHGVIPLEPAGARAVADAVEAQHQRPKLGPPSFGMQFARMAVMDLEQIRDDDTERSAALRYVREWIDARET